MANINKIRIGTTTYDIVDVNHDTLATQEYVNEKVAGAGAGFTDTYKDKLDDIEADAQVNKIEKIKVNGVEQQAVNKVVDLDIPFKSGPAIKSAVRGDNVVAAGVYATAIGQEAYASGTSAFANGSDARATGNYSFSSGNVTRASGNASAAIGLGVTANNPGEVALGKYNKTNPNQIFSVGNGTSSSQPNNAIEVYSTGEVRIPGLVGFTKDDDVQRIVSAYLGVDTQDLRNLQALLDAFADQGSPIAAITEMLAGYQLLSQKVTTMDSSNLNNDTNYPSVSAVLDYFNCTSDQIDDMFEEAFSEI